MLNDLESACAFITEVQFYSILSSTLSVNSVPTEQTVQHLRELLELDIQLSFLLDGLELLLVDGWGIIEVEVTFWCQVDLKLLEEVGFVGGWFYCFGEDLDVHLLGVSYALI